MAHQDRRRRRRRRDALPRIIASVYLTQNIIADINMPAHASAHRIAMACHGSASTVRLPNQLVHFANLCRPVAPTSPPPPTVATTDRRSSVARWLAGARSSFWCVCVCVQPSIEMLYMQFAGVATRGDDTSAFRISPQCVSVCARADAVRVCVLVLAMDVREHIKTLCRTGGRVRS